jgi:hypothetical protein
MIQSFFIVIDGVESDNYSTLKFPVFPGFPPSKNTQQVQRRNKLAIISYNRIFTLHDTLISFSIKFSHKKIYRDEKDVSITLQKFDFLSTLSD